MNIDTSMNIDMNSNLNMIDRNIKLMNIIVDSSGDVRKNKGSTCARFLRAG